jgi:hypothetical protein
MGRRYFAASEFSDGLRKPMNRDERGVWLARLEGDLRAGRIEPWYLRLGQEMAKVLRPDGCLTPSLRRLARLVGCSVRTVQRGLERLASIGRITWVRRLRRVGAAVVQTTNSYALLLGVAPPPPKICWSPFYARGTAGGHAVQEIPSVTEVTETREAREELRRIREARKAGLARRS